jgi:sialate O-acetylesterase
VQISSFYSPGENWGLVRDQQRRVLGVANTAMAVSLDVGTPDNVHPPDKQTVSARLALAARDMVYGEKVPYQGPLFRESSTELNPDGSTTLRVWFDHADGLTFRGSPAGGFELAGADHHFTSAEARIEGNSVIVSSKIVQHPVYVRYGWMSVVTNNLYNAAGLPTSTFTSEPNPVH